MPEIYYNKNVKVDERKRFTVEETIKKEFSGKQAVIRKKDIAGHIFLEFKLKDEKKPEDLSLQERVARYSQYKTSCDAQGRFLIPNQPYEHIGEPAELTITGGGENTFFVWSKDAFLNYEAMYLLSD